MLERNPKKIFLDRLEAQIAEWDAKLNLIKAKANTLQVDARMELDDQIADLQKKRSEVTRRIQDIRDRGEYAWEDLKTGAEKAWGEWVKATESVVSRFK